MTESVEDDAAIVARLQAHDEAAFTLLVDAYAPVMVRVARGYVADTETAEDVVQETWIAVLRGIEAFEGRSSLRTWVFAILINIAKKRGVRDRRIADTELAGPTVDPDRFRPADDPDWPGHWRDGEEPSPFPESPEGSLLARELMEVARRELERRPARQRTVVSLRDLVGMDSAEVCELLGISIANQRVLLHRGRAAVRQALEGYLADGS